MTNEQIETLTAITRLALAGSSRLGKRIYHDVVSWGDGNVWSDVRVIEGTCEQVYGTKVVLWADGDDTVGSYDLCPGRVTLKQQHDDLTNYIANHLKEAA